MPSRLTPLIIAAALGCDGPPSGGSHGPIAEGISAPMGQPLPTASAEQLQTFARGRAVANRRFRLSDGLGPALNVTFCASCHEKPDVGGSAGLYRNFSLVGRRLDGAFFMSNPIPLFDCGDVETPPAERVRNPPPESNAGAVNGVLRLYAYGDGLTARPAPDAQIDVLAGRNPIPFFGAGLIAELDEAEILSRADPDDDDGDGISGRPNLDAGFVGRFGRKAQTASIEGFIRGPLFNHLGVTSDPLTDEQRARLPVDSSATDDMALRFLVDHLSRRAQAAAPGTPNCDLDDAPDPELSPDDLFDLVSFAMLLAAPPVEPLTPQTRRGLVHFDDAGCTSCHTPRLEGPRGPLPVYSDLLLHDMGAELADGFEMGEASGSEFRTQPLWGLAATGPYLHDGRASTIEEAILAHGGEAARARDRFAALNADQREDLLEFLRSLGGRDQASAGMLLPGHPTPAPGSLGGPLAGTSSTDMTAFEAGLREFDREFGFSEGAGAPRFNGDSCRACHFEPVVGGAGPRGVNVIRHGIVNASGDFVVPAVGTILHRLNRLTDIAVFPQESATVFEHRQTPPLFGLGLVDTIPDAVILAAADPDDSDDDGISGRPSYVDGGRLGRFGWKAQVPSLAEFVRDAVAAELGMTLPAQPGLTFGRIHDNDDVPDPELSLASADHMLRFMMLLAPPPRTVPADPVAAAQGEALFDSLGCASCHIPELQGPGGPVALYSDLLLHEILPADAVGIEDASASVRELRTPPLWGLRHSGPYLHSGNADTVDQAIRAHDGEATAVRDAYVSSSELERAALLMFLETL